MTYSWQQKQQLLGIRYPPFVLVDDVLCNGNQSPGAISESERRQERGHFRKVGLRESFDRGKSFDEGAVHWNYLWSICLL
jgi:hypothetical protein